MKKREACGSYIITQEDVDESQKTGYEQSDPAEDPGAPGVATGEGVWKLYSSMMMECSVCGRHVPYHRYQYCPHCGSKNSMEVANEK